MNDLKDVLTTIGAMLGVITFLWKLWESFVSYLSIELAVEAMDVREPAVVTALASLENRGTRPRRVHYAGLLIGTEGNDLNHAAQRLMPRGASADARPALNPVAALLNGASDVAIYAADGDAAWIPLPFFYREQKRLGNERVQYRCTIDRARLRPGGNYSIFFIVFLRYPLRIIRWRATADLLFT